MPVIQFSEQLVRLVQWKIYRSEAIFLAIEFSLYGQINTYIGDPQTVVRVPLVIREGLQGGTRDPSLLLHKKKTFFYLLGSVTAILLMTHSHFVHAAFASSVVCQSFDWMKFG